MRTIIYIIQKEFLQIFRDKFMGKAIFAIPIIQMVILVYAATFEIKHIDLLVVDRDGSSASTELINKFRGSTFFTVHKKQLTENEIKAVLDEGTVDLAMVIPQKFEASIHRDQNAKVQFLIDAVNGTAGELALAYCRATVMSYSKELLIEELGFTQGVVQAIKISSRYWFNPNMNYKIFMAPGILAILITVIAWFMTGMNLVKEKESGTIEQLNVSPIQKYQFILGKLIPFLIIGLFDLSFGLVLAKLLYNVPFVGSLSTLFLFTLIYLFAILGIGLFISTISNTQQQVLFVSFFFVMIFVLMSGLFTPVENMPRWGQVINWFNPLAYCSRVIRMVLLKGSNIHDIRFEMLIMFIYGIVTNTLAVWRYRKTS
ncbi:MAG: ABC transporter permease [Bacteroidales bacterium]|nr:ABC transporter permease [Bacteroidales bacterium]MBN2818279.1 ABC transporter permease [Bacteroidales bacterium]